MKEKKISIGARIPESVFNGIVELQTTSQIQRTDAITILLRRGLNGSDDVQHANTPINAAKKVAEELTNYKKSSEEWKEKYLQLANEQQKENNNHPFVKLLLTEGVQFNTPDGAVNVRTLNQLFDFLKRSI